MFAIMTVSTYIISEGYYRTAFRPFYILLHRIIRLDSHTLAVLMLSLVGGYPVGIKLLRERTLSDKGYQETAEKAAAFCCCISPPFAVNMIGAGVFHSVEVGVIVYVSNALSCLIIAIIYTRFFGRPGEYCPKKRDGGLISAVNSASHAMFTICTVLIASNAALDAVNSLLELIPFKISPMIAGIFEISNLLKLVNPQISALPAAAAISSFGGVCVIAQCFAICGGAFPMKRFLLGRIISAGLSAGICRLILCFCDVSIPASAGSADYMYQFSADKGVWLLLVMMAVIFFVKNKKIFKKG